MGLVEALTTVSELQEHINAAASKASALNMTQTVVVPDGSIIRSDPGQTLTIPSSVVVTSETGTVRSWRLIFMNPAKNAVLVEFVGDSYGAGFFGADIRVNPYEAGCITGCKTATKTKNATIRHIRFEHRGMDVFGLHVRGHESLTVEKCEFRCSVPVVMEGGDNHVLRDMDLGTSVTEDQRVQQHSGNLPCTCIWIKSMPNTWVFDGSQTWQGGDHAVFGEVNSAKSGQNLSLYNFRYEQSLSRDSDDLRAIDLRFTGSHLERLLICGSRWTQRKKGFYVINCLDVEHIASWITGTKYERH